jgi:hypothetical protein
MTSETPNPNEGGEKLYAGKFKTVEELEAGYKNSLPTFQENETLKKKLEDVTKVPDEYMTPSDVALHEADIAQIKLLAKNSGLTQAQYDKLARETNARTQANVQSFEAAKKELGADKLNMIQDFVKKQYGDKVSDALMKSVITNKELREEILNQRQAALNSAAPGMGRAGGAGTYAVTQKDVMTARDEMNKCRGKARVEAQKRYIAMQHQYAHQNKG